jgi:hypothetical protein
MAIESSVPWDVQAQRGRNVWAVLCRAALRAVDVAAAAFGVRDVEARVERTELLVAYGLAPQLPVQSRQPIDWAKLSELDRGHLAREALAGGGRTGGAALRRR